MYEPVPLAEGKAYGTHVKINSWGFRDREYSLKKGNNYRVITIGDSITFGNSVPLSKTYAKQLERMFSDNDKSIEVLNMGLGGFNANQAVSFLQEKGLKFSPDAVVYGFCLNDIMDGSSNLDFINKHGFIINSSLLRLRIFQFIALYIYKIKAIINLNNEIDTVRTSTAKKTVHSRLIGKNEHALFQNMEQINLLHSRHKKLEPYINHYMSLDRIGTLRYAFDKLKRMADTNSFDVVIVIIPALYKKNDEYLFFPAHRIVEYEAKRHNFGVIDMLEEMDEYGLYKLKIDRMDTMHLNAKGHEIIARILYGYLMLNKGI
jgi:lysophospholipase L1-like esterase